MINLTKECEELLDEIKNHINESDYWENKFSMLNSKGDAIIRGLFSELREKHMISFLWANNIPYNINILKNGYLYKNTDDIQNNKEELIESLDRCIFISHSTVDAEVAELLSSYLMSLGVPNNSIFCSSLPGNDVQFNIPEEIKRKLTNSVLNIAILSNSYYSSAYCLNESGIFWYKDTDFILIAMPEITPDNMKGFLDKNNKLRNLENSVDVSFICDKALTAINIPTPSLIVMDRESNKLRSRYNLYLKSRIKIDEVEEDSFNFFTDDEKILVYYFLVNQIRKTKISDIKKWLRDLEVHNVNIDSAFDLLVISKKGIINGDYFELDYSFFIALLKDRGNMLKQLYEVVVKKIKLSSEVFLNLWNSEEMNDCLKLFVAYVVDERRTLFGSRWRRDEQIKSISSWEKKNFLMNTLSENYDSCLSYFIQQKLVYPSKWTQFDNPCEYTLNKSLVSLFLENYKELLGELDRVKKEYYLELPF